MTRERAEKGAERPVEALTGVAGRTGGVETPGPQIDAEGVRCPDCEWVRVTTPNMSDEMWVSGMPCKAHRSPELQRHRDWMVEYGFAEPEVVA